MVINLNRGQCEKLGCSKEHLESIDLLINRVTAYQVTVEQHIPDTETDCEIDRCIKGTIMPQSSPKIVTNWDQMPPVVFDQGEAFSTRVLAHRYRLMQEALEAIVNQGLDAGQCRDVAVAALRPR